MFQDGEFMCTVSMTIWTSWYKCVFSHMHREELGTQYYLDHNYPARVLPITNYSLGKKKQQQGKGRKTIYQKHERGLG